MTGMVGRHGGRRTNRLRIAAWSAAGLLLLAPLVAMQFTHEVNWDAFDFAFAATLILVVGIAFEIAVRMSANVAYRAAAAVALGAAFLLVWINAAVGIIGNDESFNLMYFGVLAIGLVGALIARFQPRGMALALIAVAVAQMAVPVIVLAIPDLRGALMEPPGVFGVFALNACFSLLWLLSAWLFHRAAGKRTPGVAAP